MAFKTHKFPSSLATSLPLRRRLDAWIWPLFAFCLGMSLTLWLVQGEKNRIQREEQLAFTSETMRIAESIHAQLIQCGQILREFQSILLASDRMSPDEYALAYRNLQGNNPEGFSLQAIAYAERRPTPVGETFLTTRFAPLEGNETILGLDVGTQPANMAAIRRSRDTNQVVMSAPFHLRQSVAHPDAVDGFIIRLPVYAHGVVLNSVGARRASITGSIGASFRIPDLIATTLPPAPGALAELRVDDISSGAPQQLYIHRYDVPAQSASHAVTLTFGGRTWSIVAHPREIPDARSGWLLVLWVGTAMSALLAALAWSLASTRERAITLGSSMAERFRKLNELLPCLVLVIRKDNDEIVYRNAAARSRLSAQIEWAALATTLVPETSDPAGDGEEGARRAVDVQLQGVDGQPFWATTWTSSIEIDEIPMWLLVASDTSEQRLLTERLSYQASHDSLTKQYNRREFETRAQALIAHPDRRHGALLFIDLDQFKVINDTSGHRAGDELLVQLAAIMREKLRPGDVLGRLGGDEFGVLLVGVPTIDAAMAAAERLRRSIEAFIFSWEQRTYTISASLGLVPLAHASSLKELFAHADAACYLAKEAGRNRVHVYAEDDAAISGRIGEMEWTNRIRDALRDGRLLLDYQELHPFNPKAGEGAHVELLLRLRSEDGSEVLPGAFLPAAERYGLMPLIDQWVVETALQNIDRLHPDGERLATCSINLSGASLEDNGLIERIEHLLAQHGIEPQRVMFEITETVAMRNFAASSALIARLRSLGCRVALDDFGAGMSSFGYLKNLELDVVKIDGSFVQSLATDRMSQSIVKAVTEIAHQQGLAVVAEWVSSSEILEILANMNVDYAQGFALHLPERVVFQRDPRA
ncbi:EAL domain-containing protein [Thermomonas sp.]|uniref:bifunctional diguanylate cyclase/phosphodiesterase n=1 Tax=Thermomonas sp. TaxID=1971895 RepID=UPI002487C898|nr:EAL domain-containing protein [Thermomonas sp.]MDI1253271.1 EAL domain-containing protein [Thermomonas sp.]